MKVLQIIGQDLIYKPNFLDQRDANRISLDKKFGHHYG